MQYILETSAVLILALGVTTCDPGGCRTPGDQGVTVNLKDHVVFIKPSSSLFFSNCSQLSVLVNISVICLLIEIHRNQPFFNIVS